MINAIIFIPLLSTFIFWLVGLLSSWKNVLMGGLISYVSLILASQHSDTIMNSIFKNAFTGYVDTNQRSAIGFAICFLVFSIVLYVLYRVLWISGTSSSQNSQKGEIRFFQSMFTALTGWIIGVLFVACCIPFIQNFISSSNGGTPFIQNIVQGTIDLTMFFINPWLVNSPPSFLLEWITH